MKHAEDWRPSKFVAGPHGLRASRSRRWVSVSSRFIADLQATAYARVIVAHARGRLLDMGCGAVPLYAVYRPFVSDVICIDWERNGEASPHLDLTVDLNGPLPLASESVDTILATDVLEHLVEPAAAVAEAARILRPDGRLIAGVPFMYWIHEQPHDYYRYTEFALRSFAERSGLEVVELAPYGGLPEIFCDMIAKAIGVYAPPSLRPVLWPIFSVARRLNALPWARRLSTRSRHSFPLGYVLVARKPARSQ
jgi:SAM-dependent methyltransferase